MGIDLGCIADDFTGASDLASEITKQGLPAVQIIGDNPIVAGPEVRAVVIALKSRTTPADQAVADSLAALRRLQAVGARHIYFKYCSTFDSTPQGNIGPVLHALARELGASFSLASPAFPINGRTVYQGYLFVGERLLSETGMADHPLTPMTDANLVRVLQAQFPGKVGLLPTAAIAGGDIVGAVADMRARGIAAAIADATSDSDLDRLGAWCADQALSSGASGLGAAIARRFASTTAASAPASVPRPRGRRLVLAGSCSVATRGQIRHVVDKFPSFRFEPRDAIVAEALSWLAAQPADLPALIYSSADPDTVREYQARLGDQVGERIEGFLADIAAAACAGGCDGMIVAGGETSGAVVGRLGISHLDIGPEISPGVPWTLAHRPDGPPLTLALKSGNFGQSDFFESAWSVLA